MATSYWDQVMTSRIGRRRALATASATSMAAALLAACGSSGGSGGGLKPDDSATSRKPGSVWYAENDWKLADETSSAVPGGIYRSVRSEDQAGHYDAMVLPPSQAPFTEHVHELFMGRNRGPGVDPRSPAAANPVPMLAEAIEIGGDGQSVTFTLRQGVKWHPVAPVNGRVMDMDDWRSTMERFVASSPQNVPLKEVLAGVEYPDARHMVWKLKYAYAPLLDVIWSERFVPPVMPKELNANPNLAQTTAIGTGYKILDKNQPAIAMEYRQHADYWGGKPFIDRWHQPIIPEYANRYAQFLSGNIMDFAPTSRDVLQLAKDAPKTVVVANPIPDGRAAKLRFGLTNSKTLPWNDPRVRIAIRRSIDFKSIGILRSNKEKFDAAGIPVERLPSTHVPTDPRYWLNPEKGELGPLSANYLFDPAEAKKLMAAAGVTTPVEIQYWVLPENGVVPEEEQLVMDSLGNSGNFKVEAVRSANTVDHRNCRSLGQCAGIVSSGTGDDYDADRVIYRDYHSLGNTGGMQTYPDPRIDRVGDAQRREFDVQKRIQLIKDFQMLAAETMPLVPFVDQYTTFRFRWPWLRNNNWGYPTSADLPEGRPVSGGHKQWLDPSMPNRNKGSS